MSQDDKKSYPPRGPGAKPVGKRVGLSISKVLLDLLDRLASENGVTRAGLIEHAIEEYRKTTLPKPVGIQLGKRVGVTPCLHAPALDRLDRLATAWAVSRSSAAERIVAHRYAGGD